ncbi:bifunctional 2-polyprenyl-6-hydroxyphenol methylase/3-demethylubiquinol 3-O-methyltransferase UbiG [Micromonospora sp. MH99]|uniref:class I SAM-dependent methyltransferase n=1 Tax=Micromonospora sp. MH99 TaxID=1945510 RepID=UPI001F3AF273|nr:class I SAM-dependent methyltransferase [Micromonospora sp. MH99]MCF0094637.1 Demethylrebeccamycin-D-glucose O-methyltransferase [Micromonospora sp. MH99]
MTGRPGNAPGAATLRPPTPGESDQRARALSLRLFLAMLHTQELLAGYLGARLGLYEALDRGPADVAELCARTGIDSRYAREWLEQQAVAGFIEVDDVTAAPERRVYRLPPGHAEVLLASDSPLSLVSLTMLPLGGVAGALPALLDAYRTGAGVPDEVYGDDWRHGHSGANRALFTYSLPGWLSSALPQVHQRLGAAPGRIADIGCGAGWAAIALAGAYPLAEVDGYDLDAPTVAAAQANAAAAGVADRVRFHRRDAVDPELAGRYDLVCVFDALHEMSQPVSVLRACRRLRADGGAVLVLDAKVAHRFVAPGDEVERFQYATSVLHCLPAGLAGPDSTASGTVLRPAQVRRFATEAGFADVQIVPVDDRFHRLYHLSS